MRRAVAVAGALALGVSGPTLAAAPAGPLAAAARACAARDAAESRLEPRDASDRAQALRFFRGVLAAQRTLVARLAAVEPPAPARTAFARLVAAERGVAPLLDEAARVIAAGGSIADAETRVGPRLARAGDRVDRAAVRLGLTACRIS